MIEYPEKISNEDQLEELLSRPGDELVDVVSKLDGDLLFLGITGKIGPSLSMMAAKACKKAGVKKRILGVSRHIDMRQRKSFEAAGIEFIQGDMLDTCFLKKLPAIKNVFYLAGMKFGSTANLPLTWAINSLLPGLVIEHFCKSRIVVFSTGAVYPLVPISSGGSVETDLPEPVGEYAQSCLGRERIFEYGSQRYKTEVILIRLNYSLEMRYGVLSDIAIRVMNGNPIDLTMGYFNVIWQGDMNDFVLRSIEHTECPAKILNITGPEILSVRDVALDFARLFRNEPEFTGKEAGNALISNSSEAYRLFGRPKIPATVVIKWIAGWLKEGGRLLNKPTHFEVRNGKY
jgi:dTDP-4-dehydrorhamnose reductase